jgi:exodeoxyribonuclease-3
VPPLELKSWNVENLVPLLADDGAGVRSAWSRLGSPDVLCLQEIRVRPADAALVTTMQAVLPGFDCHFSLCNDPKNVTFRGGRMYGVATYVSAALNAKAHEPFAWDREGRVIVTELPRHQIAIANVYAVNGTDKPYFDHALGRVEGDRHEFKRRFVRLLGEECRALVARGLDLLLVGDWNVSRTKLDTFPRLRTESPHALARREFNEAFMPSLDLVDVFRELHPSARKYSWWNRRAPPGKVDAARVDFALLSRRRLADVVEADIDEDPALRRPSDHAPLSITLRHAE